MTTTGSLNDQVRRQAGGRAVHDVITLTRFVEDAVRARLAVVPESEAIPNSNPGHNLYRLVTGGMSGKLEVWRISVQIEWNGSRRRS